LTITLLKNVFAKSVLILVAFSMQFFVINAEDKPAENPDGGLSAEELLQNFMSEAKTLTANFSQVVLDEEGNLDESASSAGVFLLERPGKFRWQVATPNELLILADGQNLWNYDIELEQATVKPIDATLSNTPAMLLSGESDVLKAFKLKNSFVTVYAEDTIKWLELVPNDTHDDFSKLNIGFSNDEIRLMELATNIGQVIRIEFDSVRRNEELKEELFKFSAPDYVDVIGEAQ